MASWGEYQSVIQLSVALNTAYAAVATYLGGDLRAERQAIREAEASVAPDKQLAKSKSLTDLRLLDGELAALEQRYEKIISICIRPLCLLAGLIGIALLVASSIGYGAPISSIWQSICIALLLPFIAGAVYAASLTIIIYRKFTSSRKTLEAELLR